jgi:hypothetical protein
VCFLEVVEVERADVRVQPGKPAAARRVQDVVLRGAGSTAREVVVDQPDACRVHRVELRRRQDWPHDGDVMSTDAKVESLHPVPEGEVKARQRPGCRAFVGGDVRAARRSLRAPGRVLTVVTRSA